MSNFFAKGYASLIAAFFCAGIAIWGAYDHAWGVVIFDSLLAMVNWHFYRRVNSVYHRYRR